ncbi:hemerythrin domain-containing protein [Mucilaginibacter mali]|jgi:hemerythrin-like domain-containing protein|uniref:Hemerythrin domain-containing protein n=1 Tax=Mucilaginibacter mali TaxID=2740462 RepID=A0A7D4TLE8_9SPHI|nr:hemerythrin domain-containing protein [Mucilaginibacter mali]QKJ28214.1 hemerythrin domain-containing protein [Mucilaginibacter mali]
MENKPIKRSEYIIVLSRDHHAGLLFGWKIKEGLRKAVPLPKILKYINFFWENHLKDHFREEEVLLFDRLDDDLSRQGKSEHRLLEQRLQQLNYYEHEAAADYLSFAELLTKHIRFEERILFPHLEASLPEPVLRQAGEVLNAQHHVPFVDNYPDEFWNKNYPLT